MPIFVHCDICKRIMGETTIDRFKKFKKTYGERCSQCQQILDGVDEYNKNLKKMQLKRMDDYFDETKNKVIHEIRRIAKMPPPKLTFRDKIRGFFVRGKIALQEELPESEEPEERLKDKTVNRGNK